jgi:hypothetical protein
MSDGSTSIHSKALQSSSRSLNSIRKQIFKKPSGENSPPGWGLGGRGRGFGTMCPEGRGVTLSQEQLLQDSLGKNWPWSSKKC